MSWTVGLNLLCGTGVAHAQAVVLVSKGVHFIYVSVVSVSKSALKEKQTGYLIKTNVRTNLVIMLCCSLSYNDNKG